MNCYDCNQSGTITPAIAVCHDCGGGVCPDHAVESRHTLMVVTATSTRTPVDPPQRRMRCQPCAFAVDSADRVSLVRVSGRRE
ncbi:hypothetical protein BH23ACT4_BH23ACT4_04530 [soil metagenome]